MKWINAILMVLGVVYLTYHSSQFYVLFREHKVIIDDMKLQNQALIDKVNVCEKIATAKNAKLDYDFKNDSEFQNKYDQLKNEIKESNNKLWILNGPMDCWTTDEFIFLKDAITEKIYFGYSVQKPVKDCEAHHLIVNNETFEFDDSRYYKIPNNSNSNLTFLKQFGNHTKNKVDTTVCSRTIFK